MAAKLTPAAMADRYIQLKKDEKQLEADMEDIQMQLKSAGEGVYTGTMGKVTVAKVAGRKVTSWADVQKLVIIPDDVLAKCTKVGAESYRMTVGIL